MTNIFNRSPEKQKRQKLRAVMPTPEAILWSQLRMKQLKGYRFRRQYGIDRYVVDFYCPKAKVAIELDGDSHFTDEAQKYDRQRDEYIKSLGISILRFTNTAIRQNLAGVMQKIASVLKTPTPR